MAASIHQLKVRVTEEAPAESLGAGGFLARSLQDGFRTHAVILLDRFFNMADDRLFEYAERASGAGLLNHLNAMRKLRTQRDAVRTRFMAAINEQLKPGWRPHAVARDEAQGRDLRMIEDKIVEQRLAIETTRQRIESNCGEVLFEFKQRLEDARRRFGLQLLDVQFAPGAICLALSEALGEIDVDVDLLVVVLKIFEQVARANLEQVYKDLNALLEFNGAQNEAGSPSTSEAAFAAANRNTRKQDPAAVAVGIAVPPSAASAAIRAIAANTTAIEGLVRMLRTAAAPAPQSLDAQFAEAVSSSRNPAPPEWANAVVLRAAASSWMFDEILGDSNISETLRDDLDALRAPFVRASLLEEKFVSDAGHPLRKLIQDLAMLAVAAKIARPEEVSSIRGIIGEMASRLEGLRLHRDLHSTSSVDEPTVQSFAAAVREATHQRRNRLVKRARELSAEIINQRVERHLPAVELPGNVSQILERVFGPLLGMRILRAGRASASFREAETLLDEFLETVAHGVNGEPAKAGLPARLANAVAGVGFSVAHQVEVRTRVETLFRGGALNVQAPPAAVDVPANPEIDTVAGQAGAGPAHDPRRNAPGMEVAEISTTDVEACAKELFLPGSWFRVHTTDLGGEVRWMQVEHCDPEQGQVMFMDFSGTQHSRQLQRLIFEVLSGQCQHIAVNLQSDHTVAKAPLTSWMDRPPQRAVA